ncbi:hypothetical protein M426DRAFT_16155 [Hypoxylon sp. CI-4A]|nr:hypothetical protein M426DRAFT_16155 [Hypoxylon sp. CI-4A]
MPIICFYERQPMDFTALVKDLPQQYRDTLDENKMGVLANQNSACLQGYERFGLEVRHNMLIKYARPQDNAFQQVSYQLKELAEKADQTLKHKSI